MHAVKPKPLMVSYSLKMLSLGEFKGALQANLNAKFQMNFVSLLFFFFFFSVLTLGYRQPMFRIVASRKRMMN